MKISYLFAGLVVTDRDQAAEWYERLLGQPAYLYPNEAEAAWRLGESVSLYLLADPPRAGRGVLTLVVEDLDAERDLLRARGIVAGPVEEVGEAGRKCVIPDPDGNEIALVELRPG